MLKQCKPVNSVKELMSVVKTKTQMNLKPRFVKQTLKEDLHLKFKKIPRVPK